MVEIVYGVATSLDGFIAPPDGSADWLSPFMRSGENYGFQEFLDSVGAVLMGSRTYEPIPGQGGAGWFKKPCYVFSSRQLSGGPGVVVTAASPEQVVAELKERGIDRAWLFGGAKLFESFRAAGLVTGYWLGVMPVVLGNGTPLFSAPGPPAHLRLTDSKIHPSGVIQLTYQTVRSAPAKRTTRAKRATARKHS
jgi:dihydrofolate reductase